MTRSLSLLTIALLPTVLLAQAPPAPPPEDPALVQQRQALQREFEAGRYQPVIDAAAPPDAQPAIVYMAAQSHQKRAANPQAIQAYQRLEARPDGDPWHFIGLSGRQVVEDQNEPAIASARQAVTMMPTLAATHYQLGLALAKVQRWDEASAAFDAAAQREPGLAYAHYYGALMHSRAGRPDRMAVGFDRFLKLAPEAPERPEVLSLMRTVRGR
jgi:tetratricopeptide (TPR) repeat protein